MFRVRGSAVAAAAVVGVGERVVVVVVVEFVDFVEAIDVFRIYIYILGR